MQCSWRGRWRIDVLPSNCGPDLQKNTSRICLKVANAPSFLCGRQHAAVITFLVQSSRAPTITVVRMLEP